MCLVGASKDNFIFCRQAASNHLVSVFLTWTRTWWWTERPSGENLLTRNVNDC